VDLDVRFITISKSLEEIGGVHGLKSPKTAKNCQGIGLSTDPVAVLAAHRKAMLAKGHISGPVFCDTRGGHLRISNHRRDSFVPILKRAGLSKVRLYDLRHTCATLLLLANESPKVVSDRLGHSSITLTLDPYSHVLPAMGRRAADTMGLLLGKKAENGGAIPVLVAKEEKNGSLSRFPTTAWGRSSVGRACDF